MKIDKDTVAWFHYQLFEDDTLLEDSSEGDPVLYLHGHKNLFPKLEEALAGKSQGDELSVTLTPQQAYGERREMPLQRVPVKHLLPKRKPRVGDVFQVQTEKGMQNVVIRKVGKFNVDVDINHPLAGKTLRFEVRVGTVREATPEELDHGHAHGHGGHQH